MEQLYQERITAFWVLSFLCFIIPIVYTVVKARSSRRRKKSEIGNLLVFSAFLVAAIWLLRFSLGYADIVKNGLTGFVYFEKIFTCIFETLRTFAVEEDYYILIDNLKNLFDDIVSSDKVYFNDVKNALVIYASILNLAAPVAGGAIIFEILASIFPKIKMAVCYMQSGRKKYFFSELNEASIALAKGISAMKEPFYRKPVFVFTDAYVDDEDEIKSELFQEAKALGAICIKDDISHVRKNRFGSRAFLLIDENESANLRALTDLCDEYNAPRLKKSEIFFVTNSDAYLEIERQLQDKLINDFKFKTAETGGKKDGKKLKSSAADEVPTFIPIKSYRNLISNMLVEIPLFEPLLDREDKSQLNVTILGTGHIGTEMFLTTYWIGQILDCRLNINIVSEEEENSFWNKIDYVNPEIRRTADADDPILIYNKNGDKAEPYCNVNYICCDARSSCFIDSFNEVKQGNILDTDYFFVALGDDDLNISVANTIKNAVGKYHISKNDNRKTVIAYVVYDTNISEVLNRKNLYTFTGKTADVLMRAVGNLEEVYSADNVFLMKYDEKAEKSYNAYMAKQGLKTELSDSDDKKKEKKIRAFRHKQRMRDDYKYWADISRSMHFKYKMFSARVYYSSVFNCKGLKDEAYLRSVEEAGKAFKAFACGNNKVKDEEQSEANRALLHRLAWLEHRRWNAFTRVKGFKHTADYDVYAGKDAVGSYKQMELKLHPCLTECDDKGIRTDEKGNYRTLGTVKGDDFDLLDELSYDLNQKGYNKYDFKQYDYPVEDSN